MNQPTESPTWIHPYIAGIVDNHFNFVISISKDSNRKIGYKIQHTLRYKTESRDSIETLQAYCSEKGIEPRIKEIEKTKFTRYQFVISRRDDIEAFLSPLREYLLIREDAISLLLGHILPALDRGDHGSKDSFVDLMVHIDDFRSKAGRANRTKYDAAYFEDEWGISATD